ncbi:MAG: TrmH family RNA methyltransferase [Candidatus Microgenomates bacterium]|jgi:TrmH family RNA methyltransferase
MVKNYDTKDSTSFTYGVYPTLELFEYRPEAINQVIYSSKGERNTGLEKIIILCQENKIPIAENDKLVDQFSGTENAYVIGIFNKYESAIKDKENHLVLVGPRDMGNLGTIIRTMVAFDFDNLAIVRPAADIFNPKAIRASMGELFQINFAYFNNFSDYQNKFKNNYYPLMTNGQKNFETIILKSPYSVIFGSESAGLDNNYLNLGTSLKIHQSEKTDSLNLATAVGIVLHRLFS